MTVRTWRKSSFSGEDNCVFLPGTRDEVKDSKSGVVLPMPGLPTLIKQVHAGRFALKTDQA